MRRLCGVYRWRYYHSYLSVRSAQGFPDLCLVRPPRVVFAELKRQGGRVTRAHLGRDTRGYPRWVEGQREWLRDLWTCAGVETYLWWPEDGRDIATILDTGPTPGMRCLGRLEALLAEGQETDGAVT